MVSYDGLFDQTIWLRISEDIMGGCTLGIFEGGYRSLYDRILGD